MFKNFFLTAIRNLKRNKVYALLNIFGLALGIGCALVIFKVITYEMSYDKHHSQYHQIYRVVKNDIYPDGISKSSGVPHPLGVAIREEMPEVSKLVRTHYSWGDQINTRDAANNLIKHDIEEGLVFSDPELFEVFDFPVLYGDAQESLKKPDHAVLSARMVGVLFGDIALVDAIGKRFNVGNEIDLVVGAVMDDIPLNTDFPFEMVVSYPSLEGYDTYYRGGKEWNSTSGSTNNYLILQDPSHVTSVNDKFEALEVKYFGEEEATEIDLYLQPLSDVHFNAEFDNYKGRAIGRSLLTALGVIGLFLVITACINFINLATAQAVKRSKEIGIRKAIGVNKRQLVVQFMSETFVITLISVIIAMAIAELLLQNLDEILGYSLSIDLIGQPLTILFIISLIFFVAILSGFYPSFLLSRMNTISALKHRLTGINQGGGISLRRALVITQFAISQMLIIGTLVVGAQMKYFYSKDLGFAREAIITIGVSGNDPSKSELLRNKLMESTLIEDVTYSLAPPKGNNNSFSNFNNAKTGSNKDFNANFKVVDHRYIDFFDLKLLAGRGFRAGDSANLTVINRKVFDLLGLEHPDQAIGMEFRTGFNGSKKVIGVVENYHTNDLKKKLDYVFMIHYPRFFYNVSVKLNNKEKSLENVKLAIKHVNASWETVFPEYLFDYVFLDEQLARAYEDEKRIASLFQLFAAIAIFIGCLGLYGLISFIASQRIKEIGVRKVLGASIWNILNIFSRELVILLMIAFAIAAPIAYYFMDSWLTGFEYRISFEATYFIAALLASLIVAVATVGYKTYFTAKVNPAVSLKDE